MNVSWREWFFRGKQSSSDRFWGTDYRWNVSPTSCPVAASISRKRSSRDRTKRAALALLMEFKKGRTYFRSPPSSVKKTKTRNKLWNKTPEPKVTPCLEHLTQQDLLPQTFYEQPRNIIYRKGVINVTWRNTRTGKGGSGLQPYRTKRFPSLQFAQLQPHLQLHLPQARF